MAGSINKVILVGRLGADPEMKEINGKPMARLRLATSERWTDKSGERQEKTEWHSVVVWSEGLAKVVGNYTKKGSQIYIEGKLQTRKWQDKDGNDRYSTEIALQGLGASLVLLDGNGGGGKSFGDDYSGVKFKSSKSGNGGAAPKWDDKPMHDEIPF